MKPWQLGVMIGIVLGSPLLFNGGPQSLLALPMPSAAAEPDAAPTAGNNWVSLPGSVKEIVQMGILAWFCWFVTSKAGPQMVQNFRDEMKAERDAHRAIVDKIGEDYKSQFVETMKLFADRDKQTHDDLARLAGTVNETVRHCTETTAKRAAEPCP